MHSETIGLREQFSNVFRAPVESARGNASWDHVSDLFIETSHKLISRTPFLDGLVWIFVTVKGLNDKQQREV
jgi:hypothetical protein